MIFGGRLLGVLVVAAVACAGLLAVLPSDESEIAVVEATPSTVVDIPTPTTTAPPATVIQPIASTKTLKTIKYAVVTKGAVEGSLDEFAASAAAAFADTNGWSLDGRVAFERVESGGDFTLALTAPSVMRSYAASCSPELSCRVGDNILINDARWTGGSPSLDLPVERYRTMVVNHEVGHWLGIAEHPSCPGPGQPAYVMQQQSKGGASLGACTPNEWPHDSEKSRVAERLGLPLD